MTITPTRTYKIQGEKDWTNLEINDKDNKITLGTITLCSARELMLFSLALQSIAETLDSEGFDKTKPIIMGQSTPVTNLGTSAQ